MAWSQKGAILTAVRDACSSEAIYIYREMHLTGFTGSRATARNILERELVAGNVSRSECPHGNLGYAWKLTDAGHAFLAGAEAVGSLRADQILKETDGKLLDTAEKCRALTTRIAELEAENERLREAGRGLLQHVDDQTCTHESVHRGGTIWTICDECGKEWADDRGGFQPHEDAPAVAAFRTALTKPEA